MINFKVKTTNNITPRLQKIKKQIANIPKEAYRVFVDNTPVRSGNARRSTKLQGKNIVADYPYAQRLDNGYSQQSPDGMIKPTQEFIQQRLNDIAQGK